MLLSRRHLLGKSLTVGAVTVVSNLAPCLLLELLAAQTDPLAFTHVTVIDATGQPALPDCTVVVVSDRIQTIGKFSETKLPKRARVIDASGKYMIPGLWDMHVHFRGGADLIPDNEAWLPVFLAYGITGVREMGGDIADTVFRWRTEIANGTRLGPRILTSGPKLDGPKPVWPGSIPVTDPGSARAAGRQAEVHGCGLRQDLLQRFPAGCFCRNRGRGPQAGIECWWPSAVHDHDDARCHQRRR
jgi:hypothetical protein